jgi:hypothetical protein
VFGAFPAFAPCCANTIPPLKKTVVARRASFIARSIRVTLNA